jgi:hypothetical protein
MKLYLLTRNEKIGYDSYDAILVCAESEADARTISPDGTPFVEGNEEWNGWAKKSSSILCEEIGEANEKQTRGVIISSFNAG